MDRGAWWARLTRLSNYHFHFQGCDQGPDLVTHLLLPWPEEWEAVTSLGREGSHTLPQELDLSSPSLGQHEPQGWFPREQQGYYYQRG